MKPKSIPYLIGLLITFCCNLSHAQYAGTYAFESGTNPIGQSVNLLPGLLTSTNPATCNGSDGSVTFGGLTPNASYQITYTDDGVTKGPVTIVSNATGQLTITGLDAGLYTHFIFDLSGSIEENFSGVILSNPILIPSFSVGNSTICEGGPVPVLPTTSNNGINGTWSPAVVNNQSTGTYTFTPATGTCGLPVSITITVKQKEEATFTFGTSLTICESGTVPLLPTTSLNGITGVWNPAVVDPNHSGTYVFTITSTGCVKGTTFTVTVTPNIVPAFPFGSSATICAGESVPTLPNTSSNGITGTWSPAVVSNTTNGTYTFTPAGGQCATPVTYTQTVRPIVTPTFSFGSSLTICEGSSVPALPNTSLNGIPGTWNPAVVSNTTSGMYTFTPAAGLCGLPVTFTVTVNQKEEATFSFGTSLTLCESGTVPVLPNTSLNAITGVWNPAVVDPNHSGTYVFTITSTGCVKGTTFTVTVTPKMVPTFSFGTSATICDGKPVPVLPNTSLNGITGTWIPAVVSNTTGGTYTFTPTPGQCATPASYTLTVNPVITPTFKFGPTLTICSGETVPALPNTSLNGITGAWSPAVVSNTANGTYTFTSISDPCAPPVTLTVTVNPIITPSFTFGNSQSVCINTTAPVLPAVSTNGITGTWSPLLVDNQNSGTYTFTPAGGQCANTATFTYQVNPIPSVINTRNDTTVYDGAVLPPYNFSINTPSGGINWLNSKPSIGLAASGTGIVPSFKAINMADTPVVAVITITPFMNGCTGSPISYKIKVLPLAKDVFVPNAFSPNGDGKNDQLLIFGNYIVTVEMHIFNQWGEHLVTLTSKSQGWDGKYKGSAQPVGVYMYVLKAVMTDGRTVNKKGSITIVR